MQPRGSWEAKGKNMLFTDGLQLVVSKWINIINLKQIKSGGVGVGVPLRILMRMMYMSLGVQNKGSIYLFTLLIK